MNSASARTRSGTARRDLLAHGSCAGVWWLSATVGCARVSVCGGSASGGEQQVEVDSVAGGAVTLELVAPKQARYPEGAPVAVFVQGGWTTQMVPLREGVPQLSTAEGLAVVYLNFPDVDGAIAAGDARGADDRAALAVALRYAADQVQDTDGCTVGDRLGAVGGFAGPVALAGYSNGGNLAWATLADSSLDLPDVGGVATFETPASGQFVLSETGGEDGASPLYTPGSCRLDADTNGIVCPLDYPPLAVGRGEGNLFHDANGDGVYDDGDTLIHDVSWESEGLRVQSLPAAQAAAEQGLDLPGRPTVEETDAFWAVREAPRAMPAVAARFPKLAGIAIGTEVDHTLVGTVDHPHVVGMVEAMRAAGIAWSRLQPDASYVALVTGVDGMPEVSADAPVTLDRDDWPMLPEQLRLSEGRLLTAGVLELVDRARRDDWRPDIAEVLQ